MITVLHGDDIVSSRNFLLQEKQKAKKPLTLDGKKVDMETLTQVFEGNELFESSKTVFIEDLLSKKANEEVLSIISFLLDHQKNNTIFLWEGKEIGKLPGSMQDKSNIKKFTIAKSIFQFLDAIRPKNKALLPLFHKALEESEVDLIFALLIRQIRLLISLSDKSPIQISEAGRLAPWQQKKLQKQAFYFNANSLLQLYKKLYEIDLAQKTGQSSQTLSQSIDFLLADL